MAFVAGEEQTLSISSGKLDGLPWEDHPACRCLFSSAFPALFFQIGDGTLNYIAVIYVWYIWLRECGKGARTTWGKTLLHTSYFRDGARDSAANVEKEQNYRKPKPDTQANQQGDNAANDAVNKALVRNSREYRYPEETHEYLQ